MLLPLPLSNLAVTQYLKIWTEIEYGKETLMQMHCGPDAFGREACTEVRWAGSGQRCLKTVITSSINTETFFSSIFFSSLCQAPGV